MKAQEQTQARRREAGDWKPGVGGQRLEFEDSDAGGWTARTGGHGLEAKTVGVG